MTDGYERAQQAGRIAGDTADTLHAALHPGDEVRGPRTDLPGGMAEDLDRAIKALGDAEDALAPGIGQPDIAAGRAKLAEARSILVPTVGGWMQNDLNVALRDAVDAIDRADRLVR